MAFSYKLDKSKDPVILEMEGRLVDKVEAIDLSVEIEEELNDGAKNFIIDLDGLEYMNSTGLNIMINLMNKAKNEGGEAVIVAARPRIKALFEVTKLNSVFKLTNNREEAIAIFADSE